MRIRIEKACTFLAEGSRVKAVRGSEYILSAQLGVELIEAELASFVSDEDEVPAEDEAVHEPPPEPTYEPPMAQRERILSGPADAFALTPSDGSQHHDPFTPPRRGLAQYLK